MKYYYLVKIMNENGIVDEKIIESIEKLDLYDLIFDYNIVLNEDEDIDIDISLIYCE